MLAMRATFDPYSGPMQLIFAFEAVVIGGIGSLWGTLIGGIVLGLAQSIGAAFDPKWFLLAGHLTFLAVLAVRLFRDWARARGGLRLVAGSSRMIEGQKFSVERWTRESAVFGLAVAARCRGAGGRRR